MFDFKLDWSKEFETGMDDLDVQHKELFRIGRDIEQLLRIQCIGVSDKQLLDIVCGLRDFTGYHFYVEERLMKQMHYPKMDAHVAFHKACADYVTKIDLPKLKADPLKELKQMHEEVKNWIAFHVIAEDIAMAKTYLEYIKKLESDKDKDKDPYEETYGSFITKLDISKVYLYHNQAHKGHFVVVFGEPKTEFARLSTLERDMYMADISKVAKMLKKNLAPNTIQYFNFEQQGERLAFHIVPFYDSDEEKLFQKCLFENSSQKDGSIEPDFVDEVSKWF